MLNTPACTGNHHAQKVIYCIAICLVHAAGAGAQKIAPPVNDTAYYATFHKAVIGRVFLSQKYTAFEIKKGNDKASRIQYRPNTNLNAGIGATYNSLSINLAYGFGFMNRDVKKGETKTLDLQSRLYGRKWVLDVFGQFYRGYYLYPEGKSAFPGNYYTRPDLHVNLAGVSAYRLFNFKRYTLRPAFMQDEWQKKSAGSFFAGGDIYYGNVKGDSALVPVSLAGYYGNTTLRNIRIMKIGPGGGYAYTLVLPYHFYLNGSFALALTLAHVKETTASSSTEQVNINTDLITRFAAGYHNGNRGINVFWINSRVVAEGAADTRYLLNTGNYRFIVARRLAPGPGSKKFLRVIDKVL